jgi:hypothetical protein
MENAMNRHFQRDQQWDGTPPREVYARLDHVVLPGPGGRLLLLAFDAVDVRWLELRALTDKRFDVYNPGH